MKTNLQVIGEADKLITDILDNHADLLNEFIAGNHTKSSMSAAESLVILSIVSHECVLRELGCPSANADRLDAIRRVRARKTLGRKRKMKQPRMFYYCYKCEGTVSRLVDEKCPYCGNDSFDYRRTKRNWLGAIVWGLASYFAPLRGLREIREWRKR
jgi:rubrerythrin